MYSNWFQDSEVFSKDYQDKSTIGYQIQKDNDGAIPLGTQVVLLGYDALIADAIRHDLYECSYNFSKLQMSDLGNLRKTDHDFSVQILSELINSGYNIIILGPHPDFITAQANSLRNGKNNIAFIEKSGKSLFSKATQDCYFKNENTNKIKLIGYQSHLLHKSKLKNEKFNHSLSLGEIRDNMRDAEPTLRDVSTINFMLESIRYSEMPGIKDTTPSGLTSEEACQLMKYFGLNNLNNCLAIYGYDPKYDFHSQGLKMMSQLIWYYIEGLDQKKMDRPESKENMMQYLVELSDYQLSLAFWKSDFSGRWWVDITQPEKESYLLPCSFMDYKIACNNEMPIRIMKELGI